jgi:hypothetical protein
MIKMMVWKILRKGLYLKPEMLLAQVLTPADKTTRREFCEEMQLQMQEYGFVERLNR